MTELNLMTDLSPQLPRETALNLHATLWEGAVMAAFDGAAQLCDWQPYRLAVRERIEVSGSWRVTHLMVRNPAGVELRFPIARGMGTAVAPGDTLDLPNAPWLTTF